MITRVEPRVGIGYILDDGTTFNLFFIGGDEYAIRFDKNLYSKSKFFNTKKFFIDADEFDKYKLGVGDDQQVVEGEISQIKLFNAGSGWRTLTCVLVYTYAYAIGYSNYRRGDLEALFLTRRLIFYYFV